MLYPGKTLDVNLRPIACVEEQLREQIRRELKHNQKVKALLREGRQPQGADWVRSKQAQCAAIGHIPPKTGNKCYFCGALL